MNRSTPGHRLFYSLLCLAGVAAAAGCNDAEVTDPGTNPKSFTIALGSPSLTLTAGGTANTAVTITTANGAGPVTLSVEGTPTGLTAAFDPSPATTSSTLTVTTVAALAAGSYTLTVRGVSSGATDQTATLTVNVVAAGTGAVTLSFAACPAAERPVWLAFQDGSGPWTQLTGTGDSYQFTFLGPKGGVAFATSTDSSIVTVEYFTESDLHQGSADYVVRLDRCQTLLGETINGTIGGLVAGEAASVSLGSARTTLDGNIAFQLTNAEDGAMDLVGFKSLLNNPGSGGRMLLRRAVNPPNGGSVGTVDFLGSESFAPASAVMTIANLLGGETYKHSMHYYTAGGGNACQVGRLYLDVPASGPTFTAYGAPAANQLGTDWHGVGLFSYVGPNSFRTLHEYFTTLGPRTLTLGAAMPAPTVSSLTGPYKRLQAAVTLPAEYQTRASFRYQDQGNSHSMAIVSATMAWLGSSTVSLSLPDFSGVTGWNNGWAPANGSPAFWSLLGENATNPPHCAAGARYISAIQSGTQ